MRSSTGDHSTEPTGSLPCVTCFGVPPDASTTQTCGVPLRLLMNAICLPSREYTAPLVLGISAIALMRAATWAPDGAGATATTIPRNAIGTALFIRAPPGVFSSGFGLTVLLEVYATLHPHDAG